MPGRFLASMLLRLNGKMVLVDCGECTQVSLKILGWGFKNIDAICFTHYHADHISGLPGMLLTISNAGREEPLTLMGPEGLEYVVEGLRRIVPELRFPIEFVEFSPQNDRIVFGEYNISVIPVHHRIKCLAYRFDIKRQGKFNPEKAKALNIPINLWSKIQKNGSAEFEGRIYTISQIGSLKKDADDARRLAAWKAEGQWYKDHQAELDDLYDKLVHLRDEMGRKLGYDGYTELGYYRMGRNCYTKEDVEKFREAVVKYLVPVADEVYREQAKRLGKEYPMSFADNALSFRSGNPKPVGDANAILEAEREFFDELSPETSRFFRMMLENELLDVLSTEGKRGGGYCTSIPDYQVPFIFANFNGTSNDVETLSHEAGHAFAAWMNISRIPRSTVWPTMEACEVHSMSMEFFIWPWVEKFFGDDTRKFLYSHLADSLTFIPYGTMVDHFQHLVYENPDWTPRQRHDCWKELLGIYMPWMRLDGEIPFYADGEGWQRQHHIYSSPFYYIDNCLAQTEAIGFWARIQDDLADAWKHYMAYTVQGGSGTFTDLLANAGLGSPFDQEFMRSVCARAGEWLRTYDLSGIE